MRARAVKRTAVRQIFTSSREPDRRAPARPATKPGRAGDATPPLPMPAVGHETVNRQA